MTLTGGEKIDNDIIKKYSIPLNKTFDFIEKKNGVSRTVRKSWTPNERKLWTLRLEKCPICQEKWTKDYPITKEHIHPLVLGGDESTVNVIPLCKKCNTSRNHVMYASLGTKKILQIRNRMPLIKKQVENFIIWAHASIYLDQEALLEHQDLTKEFEKDRGIENLFNDTNNQTPKNEDRSIWSKIKKSMHIFTTNSPNKFGIYDTLQSVEVKKDKSEKINIEKKNEYTRASLKIPNFIKQKESHDDNINESVDKAKFINIIDKLIADDEEISVSAIGQRIRRMQEHNNWQELGTRSFLKHHGFTGNYGLLNALKLCFGEQILVESQRIKFIHKISDKVDYKPNEITSFLRNLISERLQTKTFQSGVTDVQITYIAKLAKDHFEISWTKLFKPFDVNGTVRQKSVSIVPLLGFGMEEDTREDGITIYKISKVVIDK